MGMDCYANAYLGIEVDLNKLRVTKKVKAFDHNYPEDWSVDPKSGKKLWTERDYYNPEIFPEWAESEFDGYDLEIAGYKLVNLAQSSMEDGPYIISMLSLQSDSHRYDNSFGFVGFSPAEFMSRYNNFHGKMQELGLWTETFGLYNNLYISV